MATSDQKKVTADRSFTAGLENFATIDPVDAETIGLTAVATMFLNK